MATVYDLSTPSLIVDVEAFTHNVALMGDAWPGDRLRPHVKAFKSTALAGQLAAAGHQGFCAATTKEVLGLARSGLGDDLLLANEVLDPRRLRALAECGARVTVAVDSEPTIAAAAAAGITEVLIDVDVGMPRCGCPPSEAGRLAVRAQARGLLVRGVMGYEGQLMMAPPDRKATAVAEAMATLAAAHADVGGEVVSGGGTGTYAVNHWVTELQAGSFTLMDTDYAKADLPFRQAVFVWVTVVSARPGPNGWAVVDAGLKAFGMDHGDPSVDGATDLFCSDEHTTVVADQHGALPAVGDRMRMRPAHLDPTIAYHERLHLVDGEEVLDTWEIDLRNW